MQDVHLDFETYCDLDLKKVGIQKYVNHPSFRVLCAAWRTNGKTEVELKPPFTALLLLVQRADVRGHAWNAAFETAVLKGLGVTPANPISCTMQRALAYGLPGKLEAAGAALGTPVQKDMAGHKLMMRLSRPGKDGKRVMPTAAEYLDLTTYCARDAESEEAISHIIPQLSRDDTALAELDAKMNVGGIGVDASRVGYLMSAAILAEQDDAARCAVLTGGAVTSPGTQTARLLLWLRSRGMVLEDVARASIEDRLTQSFAGSDADVAEVLQIRLRTARGSTKKLKRMVDMAIYGNLHHQFQFCGAGRTGRWSGRGIQPQNLPRVPKGFSPDRFTAMAKAAANSLTPRSLNAVSPAPVLDCVSWSLRSCLMAPDRSEMMWGFDFSQIEARVLAWLAGQHDVLAVFAQGVDVYTWAAGQFGSTDRQLGKVLILALGFGMGATKLQETARKSYGVVLTASQAERFKTEWRLRNSRIVDFWYTMEGAARQAILQRGRVFTAGGSGVAFVATPRTLQMRLPSGRVLYYHNPRIEGDSGSIKYWGVGLGNRWEEQTTYGGKLAENATQAAARDVMAEAMLRLYRRMNLVPVMTVHDEIVYGVPQFGSAPMTGELEARALEAPPWAGGLPIAGEAKLMSRYSVTEA